MRDNVGQLCRGYLLWRTICDDRAVNAQTLQAQSQMQPGDAGTDDADVPAGIMSSTHVTLRWYSASCGRRCGGSVHCSATRSEFAHSLSVGRATSDWKYP